MAAAASVTSTVVVTRLHAISAACKSCRTPGGGGSDKKVNSYPMTSEDDQSGRLTAAAKKATRSEEHTSELQSHSDLVCRLLLEKKKLIKLTPYELTLHLYSARIPRMVSAMKIVMN